MPSAPENPDDLGDVTADWTGFALNVGLKLAETVGLGLTLFNALRARFEGVPGEILGDIASTIGAAIRAATGLTGPEFNQQIGSMKLPIVPASWKDVDPGDRIVAGIEVTGTGRGLGRGETRQVWLGGLETHTPNDLIEQAQALYDQMLNETDPKVLALIENEAAELMFLARLY